MGTTGGLIYALRQSDGKEIWKYQAEGEILSTMQYASASKENPPTLLLTTGNNQLYALHAETGALLWRYKHESSTGILLSVRGQCPPTLHQDKVYTGFSDGTLGAFQLSDGSVAWKIRLQEGERFTDIDAPIVVLREYLYVVSYNSGLFALRLKDGKQLWKYKIQGASSPYIREDELFLSNIHGKIVSLHAFSGRKRWEKQYKRAGALSRIVGTYNYLFVSGNQYGLYVLHRKDGRVAQILRASRGVTAAPLLWGQRLFLFANTSFVYAFSTGLESRLKFSKDF
jgi:outer membrane protein assembly factor BamB